MCVCAFGCKLEGPSASTYLENATKIGSKSIYFCIQNDPKLKLGTQLFSQQPRDNKELVAKPFHAAAWRLWRFLAHIICTIAIS